VSLDTQPCVECGTCAVVADTHWGTPRRRQGASSTNRADTRILTSILMETDNAVEARIDDLATEARAASEAFVPPTDPPDEDEALQNRPGKVRPDCLAVRRGAHRRALGPLPPASYDRLEGAMNEWLGMYARCYGVELDADFEVRNAAQLLVDTHNARDVAQVLTGVPERA